LLKKKSQIQRGAKNVVKQGLFGHLINWVFISVLKTGPVIKPVIVWFIDLLVKPLSHWSNRMTKPDKTK
jgi:hypothetical protein